jgi:hypothetical protein
MYDPELWRRRGRRFGDRSPFGYRRSYTQWLHTELAWVISPEPEAIDLRRQLHTGTRPDLPEPLDPEVSTVPTELPAGLLVLIDYVCLRDKVDIGGQ